MDRPWREGSFVFIGTFLISIGMAVLGFAATSSFSFYLGSTLVGVGLSGILGSSISYILLNEAKLEERTVAQGISTIFISLGQLVGAALIGAFVASNDSDVSG